MKLTLEEVLDNYIVMLEDENETIGYEYNTDGAVQLFWYNDTRAFYADPTQHVQADGDTFSVLDEEGKKHTFRAAKVINLNEIPELR